MNLLRDFHLALRSLIQAPVFALIAILTLGLGVGANTAIFSLVDAVLLRPLPFPQPRQLVSVREQDRQFPSMSVSWPDYLDWLAANHTFTQLAVYHGASMILTHAGPPAVIQGEVASWQYFPVLGIHPEFGRTFTDAEDRVGAPDVVVLADAFWRQRFGADPDIVGKTIDLDARARQVVGVMPPGFPGLLSGPDTPLFWVPLGAGATKDSGLLNRGSHQGLSGLGRLKPGVTLAAGRADLEAIARHLEQAYPKSNTGEGVVVVPYLDRVVRNDGPGTLWTLLLAVGLVLLIACANVANLLLARAAVRQKANAIRAALGASRARLIREHLYESLWLGGAGAGLGLAIAALMLRSVPRLLPPGLGMTRFDQVGLDWRVLGFAAGLALATSVLFGMAPAWHASHTDIAGVLKEGGREGASGASGNALRGGLVALEMGLALMLLAGAGLLIRSLVRLQQVNPGFNPHRVLTFSIELPDSKYAAQAQSLEFFRSARERIAALPGVEAVGTANPLPFSGNDWENSFTIVGRPAPPLGMETSTNYAMISGDYLQAMQMRLLRGRGLNDGDTQASPPVALIDDSFARRYFPGADPYANALGQRMNLNGNDRTIVGVVARVKEYGLDGSTPMDKLPETFVPQAQVAFNDTGAYFAVRSRSTGVDSPFDLRGSVTAAIQAGDRDQPLDDMQSMDQRLALSLAQQRLTLWLMAGFAGLALLLAAIGIYGVLSYVIAQRHHEIGVRMALGAGRADVVALVMRQGLRYAMIGSACGLAVALLLARFAGSRLYGVSWHDPITMFAVPALLLAVAALACYLPARRATAVDPCLALRGE